jgi:hypothetical protein
LKKLFLLHRTVQLGREPGVFAPGKFAFMKRRDGSISALTPDDLAMGKRAPKMDAHHSRLFKIAMIKPRTNLGILRIRANSTGFVNLS